MKPRLSLTEIYNMLDQDESHRVVGSSQKLSANPVAFQVQDSISTNQNQILLAHGGFHKTKCTYCSRPGHTMDKCYKKHGYPPGMFKGKKPNAVASTNLAVTHSGITSEKDHHEEVSCEAMSKDQIQSMISYLSTHLQSSGVSSTTDKTSASTSASAPVVSQITGSLSVSSTSKETDVSLRAWNIDSGATHHEITQELMIGQGSQVGNLYLLDVDNKMHKSLSFKDRTDVVKSFFPHFPSHAQPDTFSSENVSSDVHPSDVPSSFGSLPSGSRPSRSKKQPANLQDFHCYNVKTFINAITKIKEPQKYSEALLDKLWRDAMGDEIGSQKRTFTWSVCPLPPGKVPIGCKWIFKVKYNPDGTVERFKAQLVDQEYTQEEGVDYKATFSPVVKLSTVRILIDLAAKMNWSLTQLDISNAF
ncbi:PREDICTED: uncharacterized protein LOC106323864 [Brassica oleracea var. oleracea]|uniref:uncharacterized protein LOC106323864 n=1 Tax=Brassica oleracea var. oleracea TaxID=109376 RepID=UPI0006A727ED|nr:PREDICTED: uncharacterized protein LOC106323864 [Brassica oleracea var. oleracea]